MESNEKIARKNRKLKRLRQQLARKEEEIAELRAELTCAQSVRHLPSFSDMGTPVFFVLGRARSGTTWLRGILDAHPEILCRGEGWFFDRGFKRPDLQRTQLKHIPISSLYSAILDADYLRAWVSRSVWTAGGDVDKHLNNLTRLAVNYFLTERLSETDKKIVGDKTPYLHAEVVNEISEVYPGARVIHIIRDGRDVAVSTVHHMWNHPENEGGIYDLTPEELERREAYRGNPSFSPFSESLFTEDRLTSIAAEWSIEVGKAVEYGPVLLGDNYTEVRYEDLLKRPTEEIGRLLEFLNADTSMETVKRCIETTSFEQGSKRRRGDEDSSSFLRKGVAGDWKNVFTEEDKRIFKEAAGDLLIKLGYEKDDSW